MIDGGVKSSVAYVSQTTPIPANQSGIAIKTALAGVMQGKKVIFFDAGSGAEQTVPNEIIDGFYTLTDEITIVGGGIRDLNTIEQFKKSKVNIIVIGNKLESDIDFLLDIAHYNEAIHK